MDWSDPSLYDLAINTEQIGLDLAAKIIMEVKYIRVDIINKNTDNLKTEGG